MAVFLPHWRQGKQSAFFCLQLVESWSLQLANLISRCPKEVTQALSAGSEALGAFLIKSEKVKANVVLNTYQINLGKEDNSLPIGIRMTSKLEIAVTEKWPMLTDFPSRRKLTSVN